MLRIEVPQAFREDLYEVLDELFGDTSEVTVLGGHAQAWGIIDGEDDTMDPDALDALLRRRFPTATSEVRAGRFCASCARELPEDSYSPFCEDCEKGFPAGGYVLQVYGLEA